MCVWSNVQQGLVMGADAVQQWVPAEPGGEVLVSLQLLRAAAPSEYPPMAMWGQPQAHDGLEVQPSPRAAELGGAALVVSCHAVLVGRCRACKCLANRPALRDARNKADSALIPPICLLRG